MMFPSLGIGPTMAPYGWTLFPFPNRKYDFEREFQMAVKNIPLPSPVEVLHRSSVYPGVGAILQAKGGDFIRKLDRYRINHAGSSDYSPMVRTHLWDSDPEFFLSEWAADDPLVLGARHEDSWQWILFLNRIAPDMVDLAMYFALAPYDIGLTPFEQQLKECGITYATATLPKAIGEDYLRRHLLGGFTLVDEDEYRWFVRAVLEKKD